MSGKLTESDLDLLVKEGNEIGSHGYSHRSLVRLRRDELKNELAKSKALLSTYGVTSFSYPFGCLDGRIVAEVSRYYDSARTYARGILPNRRIHLNRYSLSSFPIEGQFQTRIIPGTPDFIFSKSNLQSDSWFIITIHGRVSVNLSRIMSVFRLSNLTKEQLESYLHDVEMRLLVRHRHFLANFTQFCAFLVDNKDAITVTTVSAALQKLR